MRNTRNKGLFGILSKAGFATVSLSLLGGTLHAQEELPPALTLTVDQSTDSTDGSCEEGVTGQCNLRAAIAKAVASGRNTIVHLTVDSEVTAGEIAISAPEQTVAPFALRILGEGETKAITGNQTSKLFTISSNTNVTLRNVRITKFQAFNVGVLSNAGQLTIAKTVIRDNKASCFGTGAMTAYATCYAGAIENTGTLTLKNGTRIRDNSVDAIASTASFTNANGSGGALVSSGTLILDGNVVFRGNKVNAQANSGYHGQMPGGANASAGGGAISNSGTIQVTEAGQGKCRFVDNQALATASTANGEAVHSSRGGAVATTDLGFDLTTACVFENNSADVDPDVTIYPAS